MGSVLNRQQQSMKLPTINLKPYIQYYALFALFMLAIMHPSSSRAEDEFMLLANRFGELCTMCEAIVLCESDKEILDFNGALPEEMSSSFTLYHFQTKKFWGQIATIWNYFARWIDPVVSETRPVIVYEKTTSVNGRVLKAKTIETAKLDLDEAKIVVADRTIDRMTHRWALSEKEATGACVRVPLRDTLVYIEVNGSWNQTKRDQ